MSKFRTTFAAASIMLAVAASAGVAAQPHKATHVGGKVKIAYQPPGNEYSPDTGFTGKVKANQGCGAKRTIKLSHYGKTKSSKTGTFAFAVGASGADPGTYKVKVLSKTISGGDVVCDAVKASITVEG